MDDFDVFDAFGDFNDEKVETDNQSLNKGCQHLSTLFDNGVNVCADCGLTINQNISSESKMYTAIDNRSIGDGNRCWAPKKKVKSIRDDVKGLGFSEKVINEADSIFNIVTNGDIFRVDKRRSIIVACIFEAYKILGEKITLESILEKLPTTNITIGMRLVETKIKKYDVERKRITYTSPVDSIIDILSGWDSSPETIEEVIKIYNQIEDKSSMLNRSRARSVAAAVVYYYALLTKRDNIKLKEFSKRVDLSESTITKNAKEISAILQTPNVIAY